MKIYRNTVRGRINHIMHSQRHGSTARGHAFPTYSMDELQQWCMDNGFKELFATWKLSGFEKDLAPSTDRLDDSKGYTLENIRLVTWKMNREKSYADRKSNKLITSQNRKVHQLNKYDIFIAKFDSIESAARAVGGSAANIIKVCQRLPHRKTAYGFGWCYATS